MEPTYSRNHNIDILALFLEQGHLRLDEFLRHDLRVSTGTTSVFLDIDFQEFSTKGLYLFTDGRPCIETAHDGTQSPRLRMDQSLSL